MESLSKLLVCNCTMTIELDIVIFPYFTYSKILGFGDPSYVIQNFYYFQFSTQNVDSAKRYMPKRIKSRVG